MRIRRLHRLRHSSPTSTPTAVIILVPSSPRQILLASSPLHPQSGAHNPLFCASNRLFLATRRGLESCALGAVPMLAELAAPDMLAALARMERVVAIERVAVLQGHAFRPLLQFMKDARRRIRGRPWGSWGSWGSWRGWDAAVVGELGRWPQVGGAGAGGDAGDAEDNEAFEVWHATLNVDIRQLCGTTFGNKTVITEEGTLQFRWTIRESPFTSMDGPDVERHTDDVFHGDWEVDFVQRGGPSVTRDEGDDAWFEHMGDRRRSEDSGCCVGD